MIVLVVMNVVVSLGGVGFAVVAAVPPAALSHAVGYGPAVVGTATAKIRGVERNLAGAIGLWIGIVWRPPGIAASA